MEERLRKTIYQKINDSLSNIDEIHDIVKSLDDLSLENNTFSYGFVIGRLYNSFHYQCRRILKRSPTEDEFFEFLDILKQKQKEILQKLDLNKN